MLTASDQSRLFILEYLKKLDREATVTEVVKKLTLRQPTVTFHINKLAGVGLINKRKIGRQVLLKAHPRTIRCKLCILYN
ncbi:hypothetical protein A3D78_01635 [Candidatus Gottesmanbacteria bacterium RIFCSPHIGHO2_02_FULL_39_14]|uniref:HTH arsR-type domain-containing protein n=2 Tax=Candidatus Gottesmaniibacteriota TaxID=1752720 RepID=A0A1F5ZYA6_9BACT|nr:MAG: hypothetical protein A3D78_01635 [Candidatus Gottesmanbacteria bacterium RIFCSPHIGHO2_02_FULL_39_14]OGG32354.1 MAG: hypothetical protein A3I51_03070 [Candidatus Gottesmanbacteria bacterium RIFCSPLOWO2_02_FULL_38_8]